MSSSPLTGPLSVQNTGHGHVRPRPDNVKARCGGPAVCSVCQREQAELTGSLKLREGDQPLPTPHGDAVTDIQTLVIADITARREVGISRYGTALQPHNGRDALRDAYEEAIDLAMYLKQLLVERDGA